MGGVLEKDPAPHLTARQEQTVKLLESHTSPFRRYPECFLCLVGLSLYYPFDDNSYPTFERPDGTGGCYFLLVVLTKRSTSAPSCFPKPSDSIKNWADHFFWVDSCVFPISVPLYTGGVLEKDPVPHLTARQEQTVKLLESHKAPFRRYPECFLCLVGLSPYYPFDKNSYPAFEYPNGSGSSDRGSEGRRLGDIAGEYSTLLYASGAFRRWG
ncbi:hypothetical protein Tco_0106133 [Tanacetum coccineum]